MSQKLNSLHCPYQGQKKHAEVLDTRKLIRTFPQCPLIRFDSERPVILKKLIELIGDELDDVSDIDIEGWIKNFKTEALLTP